MHIHQLEVDSIILNFGGKCVLSDVYLKCHTNDIIGILGRSGSGKSSLLKIIFGSLIPSQKSVRFDKRYIECLYQVPQAVYYLPQHDFLPPNLIVRQIIDLFIDDPEPLATICKDELIAPILDMTVSSISGGQKRYLEILIVLYGSTKFILLDEPFTELSPLLVEKIKPIIREQAKRKGIILTDHAYDHILDISTEIILIHEGKTHHIKDKQTLYELGYLSQPVAK
jgi:ABC-type multidrug transport system ATPase subunit